MINSKTILLTALIGLTVSFGAMANKPIYKWKDTQGNIKYTQSKPPKGTDYDVIYQRIDSSTKNSEKQKADAKTDSLNISDDITNEEINNANCKIAQKNLNTLKNKTQVYIQSDGEKKLLSAEERENRLKQAQKNVSEYCK